jgi:uncharacterized protein (TIGR02466 family)
MLDVPAKTKPVELTEKQLYRIFPTPMFTGMLSDIGMCDRIEKKLRELQKSGKGVPSPGGTILAYMTPDDLQTLPEMKELVDVVMLEAETILDACAIKRDSHYITNMWANIANPNRRHNFHIHANCLLSGIVYIKTPKNCGRTIFASPRIHSKNLEPSYLQKNEFSRAGHRQRSRGSDRRRLQRHDPRAHRPVHGAFGLELTDFRPAGRDNALPREREP